MLSIVWKCLALRWNGTAMLQTLLDHISPAHPHFSLYAEDFGKAQGPLREGYCVTDWSEDR